MAFGHRVRFSLRIVQLRTAAPDSQQCGCSKDCDSVRCSPKSSLLTFRTSLCRRAASCGFAANSADSPTLSMPEVCPKGTRTVIVANEAEAQKGKPRLARTVGPTICGF